jgi:hypothetical protein
VSVVIEQKEAGMRRMLTSAAVIALAGTLALGGSAVAGPSGQAAEQLKLKDATLIVEVNATDGDAGLQVFLDADPWKTMRVVAPNGRTILDIGTRGRLQGYGLTELFSESSEPPFDVFPLEKFKAYFPEGRYTFSGRTIEGKKLAGGATLSHDFPAGPKIVAPADGSKVARGAVVARWESVAEAAGVEIVGYRVIVTREGPLRILSADLPAFARQLRIPPEFLQRRTEYKLEVQAIERSGNQTLTEVSFLIR